MEVSLLSAPTAVLFFERGASSRRAATRRGRRDPRGGDRRATYLPQVWEQICLNRGEFLASLMQKAGIPGRTPLDALRGVALPGEEVARRGAEGALMGAIAETQIPRPLVAQARRRAHPMRPLPARLPAARRPARRLLRADARGRPDGPHDLRPLVGLLRRSGREEAAQPLLPRVEILSFGTAGCNLACKFCQNWDISKSREMDTLADQATPETIARAAEKLGLQVGRVHLQRPGDLRRVRDGRRRRVPRARHPGGRRDRGLHLARRARREFYAKMDAANVDLKGFTDEFYFKLCGAHLQPVLDTLVYLKHETNVWFEITTLLIPGKNDSARGDRGRVQVDHEGAGARRSGALHRVPSRLQDDGPSADAAGDAHARARDRAGAKGCTTSTPGTCTTPRAGRPTVPAAATR